jgi:hypothetical protein
MTPTRLSNPSIVPRVLQPDFYRGYVRVPIYLAGVLLV